MVPRHPRLAAAVSAGALLASLLLVTPGAALAHGGGSSTCTGGSIASGTYASLIVTGTCAVDGGPVTVTGNLVVTPGAVLYAAFGNANVTVNGNVDVESGAIAVLGCEPFAFPCLDDPDQQVGTMSASIGVGGNLSAEGALAVLVHNSTVGQNLSLAGGGGGVNCDSQPALGGFPAYATFEDVSVVGNASITGWRSCWLGLFRTSVGRNVSFSDNVVADPDGNEVATNTIAGNLNCSADSPAPQIGDSGGSLNVVGGRATGQCVGLTQ